jgi:hypothetical protein
MLCISHLKRFMRPANIVKTRMCHKNEAWFTLYNLAFPRHIVPQSLFVSILTYFRFCRFRMT